ncbi:DUF4376 domain-containing protein [Halomonas sp. DP5N14-9]|uniref:DUF4376 domain-containing protein n=1 Tax=Halomonas sp. DP5N14-9 TaxID=2859075 RepID=UPI001C9A2956|nr:DUF4376 domain-containing protein [Halomonas sp. DP5N14-9]MBY5942299.1 DUF4376 domain-containing protein [Halomonas sp. DP5N14-9]
MGAVNWVPAPTAEELLEEAKQRKIAEIEQWRVEAVDAGMPYEFEGVQEVVQTRAEDRENLMGLEGEANHLIEAGVTDAVMTLRVQSNNEYLLTPAEMVAVARAAFKHKADQYPISWALKEQARNAASQEELDAITWE